MRVRSHIPAPSKTKLPSAPKEVPLKPVNKGTYFDYRNILEDTLDLYYGGAISDTLALCELQLVSHKINSLSPEEAKFITGVFPGTVALIEDIGKSAKDENMVATVGEKAKELFFIIDAVCNLYRASPRIKDTDIPLIAMSKGEKYSYKCKNKLETAFDLIDKSSKKRYLDMLRYLKLFILMNLGQNAASVKQSLPGTIYFSPKYLMKADGLYAYTGVVEEYAHSKFITSFPEEEVLTESGFHQEIPERNRYYSENLRTAYQLLVELDGSYQVFHSLQDLTKYCSKKELVEMKQLASVAACREVASFVDKVKSCKSIPVKKVFNQKGLSILRQLVNGLQKLSASLFR